VPRLGLEGRCGITSMAIFRGESIPLDEPFQPLIRPTQDPAPCLWAGDDPEPRQLEGENADEIYWPTERTTVRLPWMLHIEWLQCTSGGLTLDGLRECIAMVEEMIAELKGASEVLNELGSTA
jgi:hypothetical protein